MNFKMRIKLGLIFTIPGFFLVFLIGIVLSTFTIWNRPINFLINFFNIPEFFYTPLSVVFTIIAAGFVGVALTSSKVDWLLSHIPIVKIPWKRIKGMADRIAFVLQGGYKMVMYSGYSNKTLRERPGIVLGKTIREYGDGRVEGRLVVMQPIPNVFDSLLIPFEDTEIIEGDVKLMILYMSSGGIINPPYIKTRRWTKAEYEELPQVPGATTGDTEDN